MGIYLTCFFINVAGAGFAYMSDSTLLMSLNVAFALFNGIMYCATYQEDK